MEAISTNSVKVPEPNISNGSNNTSKEEKKNVKKAPSRQYERPNVGVLSVPSISKTPMTDTYQKKKEEMPHTKYKIITDKFNTKNLKLNNIVSIGIIAAGIISLFQKK